MALVAYWMERARTWRDTLREFWWKIEPRLSAAAGALRLIADFVWGLVQAHFDDPAARRARHRLDHRIALDRTRNAADVFVAGTETTGLERFGHSNLQRRNLASFDSQVKVGKAARDGWRLGTPQVIVLGPDDEL